MPYCHKPCYSLLFGPELFGYGHHITSPSRKPGEVASDNNNGDFDGPDSNGLKCVFKTTNTSPAPIKLHHNLSADNAQQKRHSSGSIHSHSSDSSGYHSNSSSLNSEYSRLNPANGGVDKESVYNCVYQSNNRQEVPPVAGDVGKNSGGRKPLGLGSRMRYTTHKKIVNSTGMDIAQCAC